MSVNIEDKLLLLYILNQYTIAMRPIVHVLSKFMATIFLQITGQWHILDPIREKQSESSIKVSDCELKPLRPTMPYGFWGKKF